MKRSNRIQFNSNEMVDRQLCDKLDSQSWKWKRCSAHKCELKPIIFLYTYSNLCGFNLRLWEWTCMEFRIEYGIQIIYTIFLLKKKVNKQIFDILAGISEAHFAHSTCMCVCVCVLLFTFEGSISHVDRCSLQSVHSILKFPQRTARQNNWTFCLKMIGNAQIKFIPILDLNVLYFWNWSKMSLLRLIAGKFCAIDFAYMHCSFIFIFIIIKCIFYILHGKAYVCALCPKRSLCNGIKCLHSMPFNFGWKSYLTFSTLHALCTLFAEWNVVGCTILP